MPFHWPLVASGDVLLKAEQTQHIQCHYSVYLALVARHSVLRLFSPSGFLLKGFKNSRSEKKLQTGFQRFENMTGSEPLFSSSYSH